MNILTKLNWIDILVIILLFRVTYVAFQDGLSHEIFPLIGSICTVVLALHYYHNLAIFISKHFLNIPVQVLDFLVFLLLVLGMGFIFKFLKVFVDNFMKVTWHPAVEKFGGLVIGLLKATVVVSIVLTMLALLPLPYLQRSIRDRSMTGLYFLKIGPAIYEKVSPILPIFKVETSLAKKEDVLRQLASDKQLDLGRGKSR